MINRTIYTLLAVGILILAGCADEGPAAPTASVSKIALEGEYHLVAVDGAPLPLAAPGVRYDGRRLWLDSLVILLRPDGFARRTFYHTWLGGPGGGEAYKEQQDGSWAGAVRIADARTVALLDFDDFYAPTNYVLIAEIIGDTMSYHARLFGGHVNFGEWKFERRKNTP